MAQHASTAVALAALAMMAPALVPGTASAQQVAANATPDFSACDQIKDPAKSAQCHWDEEGAKLKARKAAADARGAAADARGAAADARGAAADARGVAADAQVECVKEITALRRNETFGAKATEIARELVKASGRTVAEIDACALRDGVRTGLTRLKLLPARVSMN